MKTEPETAGLHGLLAQQRHLHGRAFRHALLCAAVAAVAGVALLGVSGWFLAAAAAAGLAGPAVALGFNYLLPSAAVRLLAIVRTGTRYGERLIGHGASLRTMAAVRPALFRAACDAPVRRALSLGTGEATTLLMQDAAAIEDRLVRAPAPWAAGAAVLTGCGLTAFAGFAPLLATLACVAVVVTLASSLDHRSLASARARREAVAALKDTLALLSASAPELRCYGLEAWAGDQVARDSDTLLAAQRRHAFDISRLEPLLSAGTGCAAVLAMWLARGAGAPLAALAGLSAAMALEGLAPWLRGRQQSATAEDAAQRLDGWLSVDPSTDMQLQPGPAASLELPLAPAVRLSPGARVAVVGPSGCGKSTLVETLLGLRPVGDARIRLGGTDIKRLSGPVLRRHFAWLPQDAALIAGTVRDNLALAADTVTDAAVWVALHDAALDDRVRALPHGLDSWIGEDGALLSGGERRRLALARAYLADAPWLLLDEPTEGLDAACESLVLERLAARLQRSGQGLLAVTHRPAVIALCDRVLTAGRPAVQSTREYCARAESA